MPGERSCRPGAFPSGSRQRTRSSGHAGAPARRHTTGHRAARRTGDWHVPSTPTARRSISRRSRTIFRSSLSARPRTEGHVRITALLDRARSGDADAFPELLKPHRRELHVHCYRILGSFDDADDAVQETLLAAWRGLPTFHPRESVRTWLYRVSTNTCLNLVRTATRRPHMTEPLPATALPARPPPRPAQNGHLPAPLPRPAARRPTRRCPGPDVRLQQNEATSLAFLTALQLLSPRTPAVLILRHVLGFAPATRRHPRLDRGSVRDDPEPSPRVSARRVAAIPGPHEHDSAGNTGPPPRDGFHGDDVHEMVSLLAADVRSRCRRFPQSGKAGATPPFLAEVAFRSSRGSVRPDPPEPQPALTVYTRYEQTSCGTARAPGYHPRDDRLAPSPGSSRTPCQPSASRTSCPTATLRPPHDRLSVVGPSWSRVSAGGPSHLRGRCPRETNFFSGNASSAAGGPRRPGKVSCRARAPPFGKWNKGTVERGSGRAAV